MTRYVMLKYVGLLYFDDNYGAIQLGMFDGVGNRVRKSVVLGKCKKYFEWRCKPE
jgi:hypothetical protein